MEQYILKDALVAKIKSRISYIEISQKAGLIKKRDAGKKIFLFKSVLSLIDTLEVKEVQEEPVSEELEEAALLHLSNYYDTSIIWDEDEKCVVRDFKAGAKWQKEQIEEALLSKVLPIFMHGGEADEVVAKLDEVLSQKK